MADLLSTTARRAGSRLRDNYAECLAFSLGVALRLRLAQTYDPSWGFDFPPHNARIEHYAVSSATPPLCAYRTAYHPPLYYVVAGTIREHGTLADVQWVSIVAGIATLALMWLGLRRVLAGDRLGRLVALLLAAVMPCAIHTQAMIGNEALFCVPATAAFLFLRNALLAEGRERWLACGALGAVTVVGLLLKVSMMVFVGALCVAVALELAWRPRSAADTGLAGRIRRAAPLAGSVVLALALALPVHALHYREAKTLFPTGYHCYPKLLAQTKSTPVFARRRLKFYFRLCAVEMLRAPYYPSCTHRRPGFWPLLVATTFVDYYGYQYTGRADAEATAEGPTPIRSAELPWMRASFVSGAMIAVTTIGASGLAIVRGWRRRDAALVTMLLIPILAVFGQLYWTVKYPFDEFGPIKGSYLQFASPPLYAVFGVAVSRMWRTRRTRPLALLSVAAVLVVAAYSCYARVRGLG